MKLINLCKLGGCRVFARESNKDVHFCSHPDINPLIPGVRPIFIRVLGDEFSAFQWLPTPDDLMADDWEYVDKNPDLFWQTGKFKTVNYWD